MTTTTQDLVRDWGAAVQPVVCDRCDWTFLVVEQGQRQCPHCFEGSLQPFDAELERLPAIAPPELVIPYQIDGQRFEEAVAAFAHGIPFPPRDLGAEQLRQRAQKIYLPMWLVDGTVKAQWQAEAGYHYKVESYRSQYRGGQWQSQKIQETRLDWEERAGRLQREYQNVNAPALEGHHHLMRRLGEYTRSEPRAYQSSALRDAYVRLPSRSTEDAFREAQDHFKSRAADEIQAASEAQGLREFKWQAAYDDLNWSQLLLPVITSYYLDDTGAKRVVWINGDTAQTWGIRRGSMQRAQRLLLSGLLSAAMLVIAAVALVLALPEYDDIAAIGSLVAAAIALSSLIPVFQVWRFNKLQEQSDI